MGHVALTESAFAEVVIGDLDRAAFKPGDRVRIATRAPIGHYRVPTYLRGKTGVVEMAIEPVAIDNEEEGFGRDAGMRRHYYRVGLPMRELWSDYPVAARDSLRIEVFETWLEGA